MGLEGRESKDVVVKEVFRGVNLNSNGDFSLGCNASYFIGNPHCF